MRPETAATGMGAVALLAALGLASVASAWPGSPQPIPPPTAYRVTTGVVIISLVPAKEIASVCGAAEAKACYRAGLIVLPDPWGYDPIAWARLFIHELAHARGAWPADHPVRAEPVSAPPSNPPLGAYQRLAAAPGP